jgi:hypothetical protein
MADYDLSFLTKFHGAHLVALWAAVDRQDVALIPALHMLYAQDPVYEPFLMYACAMSQSGRPEAPRTVLHNETKRRFLSMVANYS